MIDPREFRRLEAMVLSMTPYERENPDCIDFARRKRIAKGSGLPLEKIAGFIRQFNQMRKMMKKGGLMKALMGGGNPGAMPGGGMPGAGGFNPFGGAPQAISKKEQEKKKRLAKLKKKEKQKQRRKK